MALDHCSCGVEEKNIILLGCTQAGKSFFLKSLLLYGGFEEDAQQVKTGTGNLSTTQKCSSIPKKFDIKAHGLHAKDTGEELAPSEDHDPINIITKAGTTGKHVHLNIIDTPGLSDSENRRARSTYENLDQSFSGSQMAPIDERHKISILVSLLEAKNIHAICLVKPKGPYSESLQKYLKDLISIFRISLPRVALSLHLYMVHTSFYKSERFGRNEREAERAFADCFAMDITHHFVDSLPDETDPQSIYFSNQAIAKFLESISEQRSFQITDIKYKKSDAHIFHDQVLKVAYAELQSFHQLCHTEAIEERDKGWKSKGLVEEVLNLYKSQADRIKAQIELLKTDDRIQVNEDEADVDPRIPGGNYSFNLTSKSKIAYPVSSYKSNGTWVSESKGELTYSVRLSVPWLERASAWVKIYSLKRDKEAARIQELQGELQEVEQDLSTTKEKFDALETKIKSEEKKIAVCDDEISALTSELSGISTGFGEIPHFVVSKHGANLKYFATLGVYAASLGYALNTTVPETRLPPASTPTAATFTALNRKNKALKSIIKALSIATSKLTSRVTGFDSSAAHLAKMSERVILSAETIKLEQNPETTSTVPFGDVFPTTLPTHDASWGEADIYARFEIMERDVAYGAAYLDAQRTHELTRLQAEGEQVIRAMNEIQGLKEHATALLLRFDAQIKRAECGIQAVEQIETWLEEKILPLGAFAVLRQAVLDNVEEPWLKLWADVTEAECVRDYKCGLEENKL
jgi:hypothetical protein